MLQVAGIQHAYEWLLLQVANHMHPSSGEQKRLYQCSIGVDADESTTQIATAEFGDSRLSGVSVSPPQNCRSRTSYKCLQDASLYTNE